MTEAIGKKLGIAKKAFFDFEKDLFDRLEIGTKVIYVIPVMGSDAKVSYHECVAKFRGQHDLERDYLGNLAVVFQPTKGNSWVLTRARVVTLFIEGNMRIKEQKI